MPATLAIIGRPNVGKSTLFNRLLRKRKAITHDRPGVTRDRLDAQAVLAGVPVNLIDTGGLTLDDPQGLELDVLEQARRAVEAAHLVLLVVDGREGRTAEDERVAQLLRQANKPVLVAVNKVDGGEKEDLYLSDFHALGLDLAPVSAEHGFGMRSMVDDIIARLPEMEEEDEKLATDLTFSLLGRPNAGKSSIINALVGDARLIVSDQAGTTRDAVDVAFEKNGKRFIFVDTAGVRRKTKIEDSLERIASLTALGSGKRADVTILVVDGPGGLAMQDKRLIAYLDKEKVPFLIAINKTDLLDSKGLSELKQAISQELRICPHVPVLFVSAVTGKGLRDVLPTAQAIRAECRIRVGTGELNRLLREAVERHQPPLVKGKRPKFYYLTQTDTVPATFVFFVNDTDRIKSSYARFLENQLRKLFGIRHAPVKLLFRSSRQKSEVELSGSGSRRSESIGSGPRASEGDDSGSRRGEAAGSGHREGEGSGSRRGEATGPGHRGRESVGSRSRRGEATGSGHGENESVGSGTNRGEGAGTGHHEVEANSSEPRRGGGKSYGSRKSRGISSGTRKSKSPGPEARKSGDAGSRTRKSDGASTGTRRGESRGQARPKGKGGSKG